MYWRCIRLANRSKSFRSSRLMLFSVLTGPGGWVTGVGIHFKPRESRVICSSVSCSFETQLCCCNEFSLCFYCVLFSFGWKPFFAFWIYLLLFPLFPKTQIINGDKIHIVYSLVFLVFWHPPQVSSRLYRAQRRLKGHLRPLLACFTLPTLPGFYFIACGFQ